MEETLVANIAKQLRDELFQVGLNDITLDSILYSINLLIKLKELNIDAIAMTGWLDIYKGSDRLCYMYVKVNMKNNRKLYVDILSEDNIIYNNKVRKMKKYKN